MFNTIPQSLEISVPPPRIKIGVKLGLAAAIMAIVSKFHYFCPEFDFPGRLEPIPSEIYLQAFKIIGKIRLARRTVGGEEGLRKKDHSNYCKRSIEVDLPRGSCFMWPVLTYFRFGSLGFPILGTVPHFL